MIGGGGERKTLRLVAQYADATNVFGDARRIAHKYAVLRGALRAVGRDFDEIERSHAPVVNVTAATAAAGRRPRRAWSSGSATWPTPAPSTSSSAFARSTDPRRARAPRART